MVTDLKKKKNTAAQWLITFFTVELQKAF